MQQPPQYPYAPQSGPPQQPGYPQQPNYPQQTPPYQQPPPNGSYNQPGGFPPPRKPSGLSRFFGFVRRHPLMSGIIGLALVIMIIVASIQNAQTPATTPTPTATTALQSQSTQAPTQAVAPTSAPTQAPTTAPAAIVPTHGSPHLGGNISDFYGKYNQPMNTPSTGSAPSGEPAMLVAWNIDSNNDLLSVHYYASSHLVFYIDINGPSWSKAQYQSYLITNFAPPDASPNTSLNQSWVAGGGDPYNPIAYTSSIGNFALHIADGDGSMNTV